jgi:serine/threonine protein kinase/predicted Zn-dependent protease
MSAPTKLKGRYELKEVLAKGGMGVVYRAVDGVMRRQVAIKTLLDMTDSVGLQLFQKECEVLASMTHPNIIEIYDVGEFEEDGAARPYLVMPLLPGVTLDKLIRMSSQRLTVERSVDIACQACRGLQAAHEKGLVHRDIKPSNIFVLEDDSIKIIDFGVAHRIEASRTAGRKGTLLYMAPEQIEMKPVAAVSDIFSVGVVCYEMLTRRRPFERPTESSVADAILHSIPAPASELNPAVSQVVSQAVHKAMAKQPWHRYATAKEFAETLQKALRNEPIEIFNSARMRPRLQRAQETLERGDCQYASEIVGELEGEGHLDPAIRELRKRIDEAIRRKSILHLLDTAHSRIETEEYPLALQRIYEVLQLDPANVEAQNLKATIEHKRTERDLEEWFRLAAQHLERSDFGHAREALQRLLQLRPKEGRALQLLSEVNRLEHEHTRARQEKEQLYQAAVAADQLGDVSAALSKLERVLDLDRRVPDAANPERSANYQNLYNKVRSEHEGLQQAYAEAKHKLEAGDFSAALTICTDQLAKYPDNALFQALKIDVAEQYRQALSARIAETDRKVDSEPDLDQRIAILEDAVRINPGERHFEQLLQRTRDKHNLIESIVLRARTHERQEQFNEALSQWEIVKTIYDRYPGLSMEVDRVVRRRDQHLRSEARNRWVEQIDRMLEARDYDHALALLAEAQTEHPGDGELAQLEKLAHQGLEKSAEAQRLVSAGQQECAAGRHAEGLAMLNRAYQLDDRNAQVGTALRGALVEQARGLTGLAPAEAETLLRQALSIDPEDSGAKSLLSALEDRRRQEVVDRCVTEVRQLQSQGDLESAATLVEQGLLTFPSEARLVKLHSSIKKGIEEVRRREAEESRRHQPDAATNLDGPTLRTDPDHLDDITQIYAMPEDRRSSEHPAIPVDESQEGRRTAPSVEPPQGELRVPSAPGRPHGPSLLIAQRRLWAAGALAAFAVLLLFFVVSRVSTRKPPPIVSVPSRQGTLEITTSPPGAAISVNGKPIGIATGALQVPLDSGPAEIEAKLSGYQTFTRTIDLARGTHVPVALPLVPILALKLLLPADGRVAIDNEEPVVVEDGQLSREFGLGSHTVKVNTERNGAVAFAFEVRQEGPAVITEPPNSQQVSTLLISNFGGQARIYTGAASVDVTLDGQPLGQVDRNGLDLPNPTLGNHELALGGARDLRKHSIEIGAERNLTVIIESEPNTGTLLVQTNEDDVAISVITNGREVKRGNSEKGTFRVANLKAGKYVVRAAKESFGADFNEQPVEIQKGEDKRVSFQFRRRPQNASASIRLTPGSELLVDGNSLGATQEDTRIVRDLKAGAHTFRAQKGKQFQPGQKTIELAPGQNAELDLRLTGLPVPVEIKRAPQGSTVTYTRAGDPAVRIFTGTRQDLPEGDYKFMADADGYLQRVANEHVSWDSLHAIDLMQSPAPLPLKIADWGRGVWAEKSGYAERTSAGFILFPKPLSYVQFTIHSQGGKNHAQWFLNYVNEKNYVRCEISDDGFQALRLFEGQSPEILARKKGVAVSQWYTIRILARSDGATISLLKGADWEVLGEVAATGLATTKFGFFVPEGQQLLVANFSGRAF